jgi:hypothetical protein
MARIFGLALASVLVLTCAVLVLTCAAGAAGLITIINGCNRFYRTNNHAAEWPIGLRAEKSRS